MIRVRDDAESIAKRVRLLHYDNHFDTLLEMPNAALEGCGVHRNVMMV